MEGEDGKGTTGEREVLERTYVTRGSQEHMGVPGSESSQWLVGLYFQCLFMASRGWGTVFLGYTKRKGSKWLNICLFGLYVTICLPSASIDQL